MEIVLDPDLKACVGASLPHDGAESLLPRLGLALRIGKRTIRYLGADGFAGADVPDGNFAAEKPLAETAMLLYVASGASSDATGLQAFDDLHQDLIPFARSKQMGLDILRNPCACLQLATPHILLGVLGNKAPHFDLLLRRAEGASRSMGREVVPYRELEIIWLRSLWLDQIPGPELDDVGSRTALGIPIDLLNGSREDAYAHTHAVMYYTDFGNWQRPLPRPKEEFLDESALVLTRALIAEDYDLAAEALMAWPLTSSAWSPTASFGFRVLASLEDAVGYLPAGRSASKQLLNLAGEERTRYALASSYHTAYVMGMLCALCLKSRTGSPFEIDGPPLPLTGIEELKGFIRKTGAHWERVFDSLSKHEQAALGPFLLDVAMIQSNRSGELTQMATLLEKAFQNGIANTTFCAQSAELLSRMASLALWAS